jgi:uncharacterized protein YraI
MTDNTRTHIHQSQFGRINAALTLMLTAVVALFVLSLAIKTGYSLVNSLKPEQAEAAPAATATQLPPMAQPTALPPTLTPDPTSTPQPTPVPPTPTPVVPRLVVNETIVNVRRGPGTGYEVIGTVTSGTEATITGWYGGWWHIDYAGEAGYIFGELVTAFDAGGVPEIPVTDLPGPTLSNPLFEPAPAWAIDEKRWIDVDLSEQRVTAYERQTPVQSYLVSTGLPGTPTLEGQFRIWVKFRYDDMEGDDYFLEDVPFAMYFYQGYGFHGVWWHANFGNPMSHGCVNQPNEMAEWLFDFAEVGTLVNVHE